MALIKFASSKQPHRYQLNTTREQATREVGAGKLFTKPNGRKEKKEGGRRNTETKGS